MRIDAGHSGKVKKAPKGTRKVEWPDLDNAQRQELDNRLMIIDWVRDTINAPAEELGPSQLAQRAVDLISNVAGDRVTYRITKGEDLREQGYRRAPSDAVQNVLRYCWRWITTNWR
ncbi:hypothetical protein ACLB1R_02205 [Escherichia coli]